MKHVHATWYRLEDGNQVDPDEVSPDAKGVLRHKSGVAVALRDNGAPLTAGARDKRAAAQSRDMTAADDKPPSADREMKPAASGKGYRTRGR